jgi:hypothetical protein
VVFAATSKNERFIDDILTYKIKVFRHYYNSYKGLYNVEDAKESLILGNRKCMEEIKVGSF